MTGAFFFSTTTSAQGTTSDWGNDMRDDDMSNDSDVFGNVTRSNPSGPEPGALVIKQRGER